MDDVDARLNRLELKAEYTTEAMQDLERQVRELRDALGRLQQPGLPVGPRVPLHPEYDGHRVPLHPEPESPDLRGAALRYNQGFFRASAALATTSVVDRVFAARVRG